MRTIFLLLSVLALVLSSSGLPAADTVVLENCYVSLVEDVEVPAQEAGVLVKIPVREGNQVAKGDLLAQIDDIIPQAKFNIAKYKLEVAETQAKNDIEVRYAKAGFDVADAKLRRSLNANKLNARAVSEDDIDEQKLERIKFWLSIEKAQKDFDIAGLQKQVSKAEWIAAQADLEHRKIVAPLDAVVVELKRHEGEWAAMGDPVMRLLRIDRLRVEGRLNVKDFRLSDIEGRPVQVTVTLAHGQQEKFSGKIVFVEPIIQHGGDFLVRAEVENRQQGKSWILNAGMKVEMAIQLK
jgi:multidrug efflux pump subunit AcrA (membrane-fusion protein)